MNNWIGSGRLTAEPKVTYGQGENSGVARFSLAVERRFKRDGQPSADFINCVAFGKSAEFVSKYLHKGTKIIASGHIQTGSYTNRDGQKVYTTDVIIDQMEFAESKAASQQNAPQSAPTTSAPQSVPTSTPTAPTSAQQDDFMNIPDGLDGDQLPFS